MVGPLPSTGQLLESPQVQALFWHEVLAHAVQAPSLHNSQPWAFRLTPHGVAVLLDTSRVPTRSDPKLRQSLMSCGAVVFNLRVALLSSGRRAAITSASLLGEQRGSVVPVAGVAVVGRAFPTPDAGRLFGAIAHRRTWIGPYREERVADPARRALVRAAAAEGAHLQFITDSHQRARAEQTIEAATAAGSGSDNPDRRTPSTTDGSVVAILTTHRPTASVAAGQALQRVLLTGAAHGLSSTIHADVIESREHRSELRQLLGQSGAPQVVLHLGYGGPVQPSPRRDVEDFLLLG